MTWRTAFLTFLLATIVVAQEPTEHRDDKFQDDPHARCLRPEVVEFYGDNNGSTHPCSCHQTCANSTDENGEVVSQHAREDSTCAMYCSSQRCGCHPDSDVCEVPMPSPAR